jgi:AraC-like DNA-binding protein
MRIRVNPDSEATSGLLRLQVMQHGKSPPAQAKARHYRRLAARIADIACARMAVPVHIAELCRIAAVSQRTLRHAFHVVYGVTPHRYLRMQRMIAAREELLAAEADGRTVTEIATGFGFFELGRFAVEYRSMFGESPSATLRRASGAMPALTQDRGVPLLAPTTGGAWSLQSGTQGAPARRRVHDTYV